MIPRHILQRNPEQANDYLSADCFGASILNQFAVQTWSMEIGNEAHLPVGTLITDASLYTHM